MLVLQISVHRGQLPLPMRAIFSLAFLGKPWLFSFVFLADIICLLSYKTLFFSISPLPTALSHILSAGATAEVSSIISSRPGDPDRGRK